MKHRRELRNLNRLWISVMHPPNAVLKEVVAIEVVVAEVATVEVVEVIEEVAVAIVEVVVENVDLAVVVVEVIVQKVRMAKEEEEIAVVADVVIDLELLLPKSKEKKLLLLMIRYYQVVLIVIQDTKVNLVKMLIHSTVKMALDVEDVVIRKVVMEKVTGENLKMVLKS